MHIGMRVHILLPFQDGSYHQGVIYNYHPERRCPWHVWPDHWSQDEAGIAYAETELEPVETGKEQAMYSDILPSDHVVIEALDDYLAQQAYERVDHLEAVLKSVADLLEVNKTPENVEKAIAFIRSELSQEEPEHNWEAEKQEATYVPDDQFDYLYDPMED